ncbi:MAG: GyrI-like domain-containing protein, partial [Candidatus Pacebacteria bacterium]|nr:GyrI-like domain-containing protein [Candidatus Paceibacterota bacterium]
MLEKMNSKYISKINKAIDYIQENIRDELKLESIAKASGFSSFHFHRIFKSVMNENLNHFIRRIKVERAASMIFSNPSEYKSSKICYIKSKKEKEYILDFHYNDNNSRPTISYKSLKIKNMKVEIRTLEDITLAYIRHIGAYKNNPNLFEELFSKLCTWAGPRNLINQDSRFLCIYYDGPEVTDESKLRLDVCLEVSKDAQINGEVGKQEIKGGEYAIARCIVKDSKDYEKYWNELYLNWLP